MRLVFAFLAAMGIAGVAAAEGPRPIVPAATGEPHPEGNEYWRKHHMELMRHDRDLTLREGVRDIEASLGQCFDCHAVQDETGAQLTAADEGHFCRVCHDYAAVQVDCFTCHRSTPDEDKLYRTMATPADHNSIAAYLARLSEEETE
jgi:predicted CXXCH cytochrome family protein